MTLRQCEAEREIVYEWCRRLDLPLMTPPRTPEAIDSLGREVERLRAALESVCNVGDRAAVMVAREALRA